MSKLTIRGSVGCLILTFAAGLATACSTSNRSSPASSGNAKASARVEQPIEEDDPFLQPASASLASTRREAPSRPIAAADPIESPGESRDAARAKSESMARPGEPGCAMHAENTPSGIAVIFTAASSSSPDRVAAQTRALAAELERERLEAPKTEVEPSTFGTRQIAELAAQTFVTQTPAGARLTIDAKDRERVEALRARVLWQMSRFMPDSRDTRGECPVVPRVAAEQREREAERPSSGSDQSDQRSEQ